MLYSEFVARAKKPITIAEYHAIIEPVYTNIEGMSKDLAARMYDELGLGVFKALLPYGEQLEQARNNIILLQDKLIKAKEQYNKLQ